MIKLRVTIFSTGSLQYESTRVILVTYWKIETNGFGTLKLRWLKKLNSSAFMWTFFDFYNPEIRLINLLKETNHGAIYSTQLLTEMSNYPYSKNDDIQTKFLSVVDKGKKNYYTYILLDPRWEKNGLKISCYMYLNGKCRAKN